MENIYAQLKKHQFLFEELVKRDFKQKYKRTVLGMFWSILYPLLILLIMDIIFSNFFGRSIPHYPIFLFCGNTVFHYFNEATNGGMNSLLSNASVFTKINMPKYLFLLSKNVSAFINFILTLIIFFVFVIIEGIPIRAHFIVLLFPVIMLLLFNIGVGLILSALYVFFRDMKYHYNVFTRLLMYLSAIFYSVEMLPAFYQQFFYLNPVYCYIKYFRVVVLEGHVPSVEFHGLCLFYALVFLFLGGLIYRRCDHKFLYYL